MKTLLRTLALAAGVSATLAGAATAQTKLIVIGPASVAGEYNVGQASGTWGFDPAIVPPFRGIGQKALPDTIACTNRVGALATKIAFLYRGSCEFGSKALAAETAGAGGCVIINNRPGDAVGMGPGADGATVTIPTVMISQADGLRLLPFINDGTLDARIGSLTGLYPFNLSVTNETVINPPAFAYPSFQIRDTGVFKFTPGFNTVNSGNQAQTNVKFKATITRRSTNTILYQDSSIAANIAATGGAQDTVGSDMAPFDLYQVLSGTPSADLQGIYDVRYEISSVAVDSFPADNFYVTRFVITDSAFSRSRIKVDTGRRYEPVSTGGISLVGGGAIQWGLGFTCKNSATLLSMTMGGSTGRGVDMNGESISGDVSEWSDNNNDGGIDDDELTLIGSGSIDYTDTAQRSEFIKATIFDNTTSQLGAPLDSGKNYIFIVNYAGSLSFFLEADNTLEYGLFDANSNTTVPSTPLRTSTGWGGFASGGAIAMRADMVPRVLATKPSAGSILGLKVYPNPSKSAFKVFVGDKVGTGFAELTITDIAGRALRTETRQLMGTRSDFSFATGDLQNGTYNLTVRTNNGVKTTRFSVVR